MDLVTVVITTHKREAWIVNRALNSVINQTYRPIEIIVVDDSPEDYQYRNQVKELVESHKNVQYIQHETCMGACVARNTGLNIAQGKYIAFLDDDDEWKPNKIKIQINAFIKDDIALVYCGNDVMNDLTGVCKQSDKIFKSGRIFDDLIMDNFVGSTSFPLIKTNYLKEIDGFDPLMKSAQDYDVWLRLSQKYDINYVEDSLVIYHVHGLEQITKGSQRKVDGLERLNDKNMDYLQAHPKAFWYRTLKMAPIYAENKQFRKAIHVWMVAFWKRPYYVKENLRYLCKMFLAIGRTINN